MDGIHGGLEEERQERAREQDDDEAIKRYFTEKKGPVVREYLAAELFNGTRDAGSLVEVV